MYSTNVSNPSKKEWKNEQFIMFFFSAKKSRSGSVNLIQFREVLKKKTQQYPKNWEQIPDVRLDLTVKI